MTVPFDPPVALASLSGEADAAWARAAEDAVGCAFLGGIALDEATRAAAREMVDRDRSEFLPADPVAFVDDQFEALADADLRPGINVRSGTTDPVRAVAAVCRDHDAVLEVNAHCRQEEMCAAGAGHGLLRNPGRLCEQVRAAREAGATTSVKLRTEVEGVALPAVCRQAAAAGADLIHVDAMDSEPVVADLATALGEAEAGEETPTLVANNGVRGAATVAEYAHHGADAVSAGRPTDDPAALRRIAAAVDAWRAGESPGVCEGDPADARGEAEP